MIADKKIKGVFTFYFTDAAKQFANYLIEKETPFSMGLAKDSFKFSIPITEGKDYNILVKKADKFDRKANPQMELDLGLDEE